MNTKTLDMGIEASKIFGGQDNTKSNTLLYNQTARDFVRIITSKLPQRDRLYTLADFGSFKGELLGTIVDLLRDQKYNLSTIAIDGNAKALAENKADFKIVSDLTNVPLADRSVDLSINRYTLAWNSLQNQGKILEKMARTCREFAIVQHAGADNYNSDAWRARMNEYLSGRDIPKIKREGHYFSSRDEIERILQERKIPFIKLEDIKVDSVSDVFIKRYNLTPEEAVKTIEILKDKDYAMKTTWLLLLKS